MGEPVTVAAETVRVEAAPLLVPEGKRLPFGWGAFAVSPAGSSSPVVLHWPPTASGTAPARLRVTVALDMRENKQVEARNARTGALLGTFDIRFASICQPFEILVTPEQALAAAQDGVSLHMTHVESALWLFNGQNGAPASFAPHWVSEQAGDRWAQFEERMCSLDSIQTFGWIEGCVLDGLWQMARRNGHEAAQAALSAHLRLFVSPEGALDYQGPISNPLHNTVYGMEGLLPFALIAQVEPDNPVLALAIDYCQEHRQENGAVTDYATTTTEGAYIAGYPLAVIGKAQGRGDLTEMALHQLSSRHQVNVVNDTIFQAVGPDGKGHLPNWARGVGWYLLGFARVLDILNPGTEAADLYAEFRRAAQWAMAFQQENGLWRNFLDDAQSEPDTSGSAGIAAALALGARRGYLPMSAREAARRCLAGLEPYLTPDGFLGGMAQFNKGGEALQRANYRVMAPMAMGLAAQLRAELQTEPI